jgi:2,4-dienoyl-CoA reductase-like NADH-dependent reductase (Old Yellow Enzyme family)
MGRTFFPDGMPTVEFARYHALRAENAVSLIITGATPIGHPAASNHQDVPHFAGAALDGWREVVRQVHAAGGRIFPQLWHAGADRDASTAPVTNAPTLTPSGVDGSGAKIGEPMNMRDIDAVIEAFAVAAANAKRIGFDGIEVHGAHGFLLDYFMWDATNWRADRYGGDLGKRVRFAAEVVAACRAEVRPDYPISFRLSQWKMGDYQARLAETPEDLARVLMPLAEAGVDLFHSSTRRFWLPEFPDSPLNLAAWTKEITGKPAMTVGSVGLADSEFQTLFESGKGADKADVDLVAAMVERGEVDLVAVGRALLGDPEWAVKIRDGRSGELQSFDAAAVHTLR